MDDVAEESFLPSWTDTLDSHRFLYLQNDDRRAGYTPLANEQTKEFKNRQVINRWALISEAWKAHLQRNPGSPEANIAFVSHICYGRHHEVTTRDLTERMDAFPVFYTPGDSMLPSFPEDLLRRQQDDPTLGLEPLLCNNEDTKCVVSIESIQVIMILVYATYATWCIYDEKLKSAAQVEALEEEFTGDRHLKAGPQYESMHYYNVRYAYEKNFLVFLLRRIQKNRYRDRRGMVWELEDVALRRDFRLENPLKRLGKQLKAFYKHWFWQFFFYRLIAVTGKGMQFVRPLFEIAFGRLESDDFDSQSIEKRLLLKMLTLLTTNRESIFSAKKAVKTLALVDRHPRRYQANPRNLHVLGGFEGNVFYGVMRFVPGAENLFKRDSFMAMAIVSENATLALALASESEYSPFRYNLGFRPDIDGPQQGIRLYSDIGLLLKTRQKSHSPVWKEVLRQMIRRCDYVVPWGELYYPMGSLGMGDRSTEVITGELLSYLTFHCSAVATPMAAARTTRSYMQRYRGIFSEKCEHTSLWEMARVAGVPRSPSWKLQVLIEEGVVPEEKAPAAPLPHELARMRLGLDTGEAHERPYLETPRPGKRRRTGQNEEVGLVAAGNASHPPKPYSILPGFPSTQAMQELVRANPEPRDELEPEDYPMGDVGAM